MPKDQASQVNLLALEVFDTMRSTSRFACTMDQVGEPLSQDDMIVTPVGDELVIHDPRPHATHHLNATATRIWWEAKRGADIADIARTLQVSSDTVPEAMQQLAQAQLLPAFASSPTHSRRRLLQRAAVVGAPIVILLTAPLAVAHVSPPCPGWAPYISVSYSEVGGIWSIDISVSGFCPDAIYAGIKTTRQNDVVYAPTQMIVSHGPTGARVFHGGYFPMGGGWGIVCEVPGIYSTRLGWQEGVLPGR